MVIEIFVMEKISTTQIKKNNEKIVFLKDLPAGLKRKLSATLKIIQTRQVVVNDSDVLKSILVPTGTGANKILSEMDCEDKKQAKEIFELLVWYFKQHFFSYNPGLIGGDIHCSTCGSLQSPSLGSQYCENPYCASHELWKKIIGASYKIPRIKRKIHIQRADSGLSPEQVKKLRKELKEIMAKKAQESTAVTPS